MYLCFIDESQTPPNPGQQNRPPYFIIAGVVIHEAQRHGISDDLKASKARPEFNVAHNETGFKSFDEAVELIPNGIIASHQVVGRS